MKKFEFGTGLTRLNFFINDKNEIRLKFYKESLYDDSEKEYIDDMSVLSEVEISGRGGNKHGGDRHFSCSESVLLKYKFHSFTKSDKYNLLTIVQEDDICELTTYFCEFNETNTIRVWNSIKNISDEPFTIEYISSFVAYGLFGKNTYDKTYFYLPSNGWYSECQWKRNKISDLGVFSYHLRKSMKKYCVSSTGSWSTKSYLPMGLLEDSVENKFLLWQIESNGSWTYEMGDICRSLSLHLSGPSFQENGWAKTLKPKEVFETVKVAVSFANSFNEVFENITRYRRNIIWKSESDKLLPTIFNEYMFASGNSPSLETIEQLAPMAKKAGVDYYVIDCGWHDEVIDPFYHVGKWIPSKLKYPNGFKNAIDKIKSFGLKVGLWMEPEVVGTFGDASLFWDDDCYLTRYGKRIVSSSRYFLDYRNPKVCAKMNSIVDGLINDYGINYFKFDYNVDYGVGTDKNSDSFGDGALSQCRAVINWIKSIKQRHNDVVLECCCSGGNRMDYLSLSYSDMVSTSDQTDCYLYPYIIGNMLSAVLPEQAAVWSYPVCFDVNDITKESVCLNMVNSLLGRMHLASKLYLLNDELFSLVQEGVDYYNYLKVFKPNCVPFFPNGFCKETDNNIVVGLKNGNQIFLFVYFMGKNSCKISFSKEIKDVNVGYPLNLKTDVKVNKNNLMVSTPTIKSARIFEIKL